jgi:thioredoxin-related protein
MKFKSAILTVLLFLFIGFQILAQDPDKVHWLTVSEMQEAMKKEPRKVLIDVYTNWCGPCKMMMSQTFADPTVIKYINTHYYAVKFNAEGNDVITFKGIEFTNKSYNSANAQRRNGTHEFTKAIAPVNGRIAYPTIVYLDESLQIVSPVQGFWKAPQYIPLLYFIHEEVYKTEISFENYLKQYTSK